MEFGHALRAPMSTFTPETGRPTPTQDPLQQAPPPPTLAPDPDPTITPTGASPTLDKLFGALAKAQGAYTEAAKDSYNPWHKYHYASMASMVAATRPALSANGLCVTQRHQLAPKPTEPGMLNVVRVQTVLGHESGQWMTSIMDMPVEQRESESGKMQQLVHCVGAACTYAERYTYKAMCCVPVEDADGTVGDGAEQRKGSARPARRPAGTPPAQEQPEPTYIPDDHLPPDHVSPPIGQNRANTPMTNSQFAASPASTPQAQPAPATPTTDAPRRPWCPMCHALATIYDARKYPGDTPWLCGVRAGGCGAWFDWEDTSITKQDGTPPPDHVQANHKETAGLSAELTKMGKDANTAFQAKWSQKLKIGSFHLLSLRQLVIMQRILDREPAYIEAKKQAEHQRQGQEAFG